MEKRGIVVGAASAVLVAGVVFGGMAMATAEPEAVVPSPSVTVEAVAPVATPTPTEEPVVVPEPVVAPVPEPVAVVAPEPAPAPVAEQPAPIQGDDLAEGFTVLQPGEAPPADAPAGTAFHPPFGDEG